MADRVSTKKRSEIMRAVKSTHTKPEMIVRRQLHALGFRYSLHVQDLPGRPDIVLRKYRAVVQVHGCFWHGHECPRYRLPKSRQEFWSKKIQRNRANDTRTELRLRKLGWRVATVWECSLRGRYRWQPGRIGERLSRWLAGASRSLVIAGVKPRDPRLLVSV